MAATPQLSNTKDISTGHDFSLQINGPNGVIAFVRLNNFSVRPEWFQPESSAIDGITRRQSDPKGYTIEMEFERTSNFIDAYLAAQEANFLVDGVQQYLTGTETINEKDGSTSQYIYQNCDLQITDLGNRKLGDFVMVRANMFASTRLSSPGNI